MDQWAVSGFTRLPRDQVGMLTKIEDDYMSAKKKYLTAHKDSIEASNTIQ
jgi:hypothetical protein